MNLNSTRMTCVKTVFIMYQQLCGVLDSIITVGGKGGTQSSLVRF